LLKLDGGDLSPTAPAARGERPHKDDLDASVIET